MTICPGATETAIYNTAGNSILTFPWMFNYGDQLFQAFKTQKYAELNKLYILNKIFNIFKFITDPRQLAKLS